MKKSLLALGVILLAVLALYFPSLSFDFAWLDHAEILGGQLILNSLKEFQHAFLWDDGNHSMYHRPFYNIVHSLDFHLWGSDPSGYHLTNILFHLCNTVLVYTLLKRLGESEWLALGMAALWTILPIHSPVVGLIHAKGDLVSTFFLLSGAILLFKRTTFQTILGSTCLLFALLTKEVALAGLLLIALWQFSQNPNRYNTHHLAWGIPLVLYGLLRWTSFQFDASDAAGFDLHRVLTFPLVYGSYFWESLPGLRLSISDTVWAWNCQPVPDLIKNTLFFVSAVAFQMYIWRFRPEARKYVIFFNLLLLPVSQIVPTLHFRADRFLYLASLGWIGIWSHGFKLWSEKFKPLIYIPLILGLWWAFRVYQVLPVYENNDTLFTSVIEFEPLNREARGYMGLAASQNGEDSRAIFHLSKALNGNPKLYSYVDRNVARANLGTSQMRLMQYESALQNFLSVSQATDEPVELDFNIGLCYKMLGRPQEAYDRFVRYQRKYPEDIQVMEKLVEIYVDMGKRGKAIEEINRILAIDPRHPHVASLKQALIDLQEQR